MSWLFEAITVGILSFAATNIDDIFVLTLFFGQAGRRLRPWHVIAGQYLGLAALVAISLVGYLARMIVPPAAIGLLGVFPIIIGVRSFFRVGENGSRKPKSAAGVFSVAVVTFANGGDNIGVYTPLFAASNLSQLLVVLSVFFMMVAVWCAVGYFVGTHPAVKKVFHRYGHVVVPFVLIGLGLYIIFDSGILGIFGRTLAK